MDYFKNHKQFGIDWIYPIVNDRKKLYQYSKPAKNEGSNTEQKPELKNDATKCYIPEELNYFDKLNQNLNLVYSLICDLMIIY